MNMKQTKVLSQMVGQFQTRHQRLPEKVVVDPAALVVLTFRRSVSPKWAGIPVTCREIAPPEQLSGPPNALGVGVVDGELRSFDLLL